MQARIATEAGSCISATMMRSASDLFPAFAHTLFSAGWECVPPQDFTAL